MSKPTTVKQYLDALPADRREALEAVRETINANLDPQFEEGVQYGMIGWYVPHSVFPDGYHCDPKQPLPFASIASQKNHMAIYLFCIYTEEGEAERFAADWKATGKKLDMGKSCVRFKKLDDVPLAVLGKAIKRATAKKFIAAYLKTRDEAPAARAARKKAAKKTGKKVTKKATGKKVANRAAEKAVNKKASKKVASKATAKKATRKAAKKTSKRATKKVGARRATR